MGIDHKRKASDDQDAVKASKRVKSLQITSPEQEKRLLKVINFPEKVSAQSYYCAIALIDLGA